jgi:translation initiation factor IF-3
VFSKPSCRRRRSRQAGRRL